MHAKLQNLSLSYYRGIGPTQKITGLRDFNFFIGANNSGKSTVLNFISRHLAPLQNKAEVRSLEALEQHGRIPATAALGISTAVALEIFLKFHPYLAVHKATIEVLFNHLSGGDEILWRGMPLPLQASMPFEMNVDKILASTGIPAVRWHEIHSLIAGKGNQQQPVYQISMEDIRRRTIPQIVNQIKDDLSISLPVSEIIPAIREIGPAGSSFDDYSGRGLIDRLAVIQSPDHDHRDDRLLFDKINNFLGSVTDRPNARIEIPYNRAHILVHMDDRVLPLPSLGTGIHEVIMIASFCTLSDHRLVCIEEPELHLHPLPQRKLIDYLRENTSNQYFIATHSAAFIDTPDAAIYHVKLENGLTVIEKAILNRHRHEICADLGYRASDIVQANAVIWVEGPSDRIYINKWLSQRRPDLVEGIHYSIMFYGGRLLSHLSADDDDVRDFIQLRSLNRNTAIVIDSDKAHPQSRLNDTKKRVKAEIDKHGGYVWITEGREIENYIAFDRLQAAVREVHSTRYAGPVAGEKYDRALQFKIGGAKVRSSGGLKAGDVVNADKVRVARTLAAEDALSLDVLDLRRRIDGLVDFILKANRH